MHAETLAYLFHNLPYSSKLGPAATAISNGHPAPENSMIEIPAGEAVVGGERGDGFGWDHEFRRRAGGVPGVRVARFKITTGAHLELFPPGARRAPHSSGCA